MALLLHPGPVPVPVLRESLRARLGELDVRVWPDCGDPEDIRHALVSRIPAGELARFPRLELVASLHAGVDHLLADATLPAGVPVSRPVSAEGDVLMNEFILAQVLRHHRDMPAYAAAQARQEWLRLALLPASARRVGFLGLGAIGLSAARYLMRTGFDVAGWVRRPRTDGDVPAFHGEDGLRALVSRSHILVNLLPFTPATQNIIDRRLLGWLPAGAALVNVGRGQHVVDADLLAALDSGHLAAATLDVFRQEPLAPADPLWRHPAITITPHASRRVDVDAVVRQLADDMARLATGLPPRHTVDRAAGY